MYFSSKKPTWRQQVIDNMLAALSAIPGAALIVSGKIHLMKATLAFTPQTPIASFTAVEADFTGYSAANLGTLTGPLNLLTNTRGMLSETTFVGGNPLTTQNTLYGYYIDQNTAADWVLAELFPYPVPIANPGDFLNLQVLLPLLLQLASQ